MHDDDRSEGSETGAGREPAPIVTRSEDSWSTAVSLLALALIGLMLLHACMTSGA